MGALILVHLVLLSAVLVRLGNITGAYAKENLLKIYLIDYQLELE